MTTDTDKLRELCKKATPGPWEFVDDEDSCYSLVCRKGDVSNSIVKSHNEDDIDFIAAANPQSILALLDELDRLRDALTDKDDLLRHIGDYAHDRSAGPAMPDDLWEVRRMAYEGYAS